MWPFPYPSLMPNCLPSPYAGIEEMKEDHDPIFDSISYTAGKILQKRALHTNIPFAKEMADVVGLEWRISDFRGMLRNLLWGKVRSGYFLQLRYNALSQGLQDYPGCPVLEIAAGFTTRGLVESKEREAYIESDLENLASRKRMIVEKIRGSEPEPNHHFRSLNICSLEGMDDMTDFVSNLNLAKPIVVIHEGLLMYLKKAEKEVARDNIKSFLQRCSPRGAWITTDFSERNLDDTFLQKLMTTKLTKRVDRDFEYFQDDAEVESFLRSADLQFTKIPNLEAQNPDREIREIAETLRAHKITIS